MATKLVNMKVSKAEREARYSEKSVAADAPSYPYGLSINLDDEALEKLGLEELPAVDAKVMIVAKATVTNVSSNASTGGEKRRSIALQITDLCLESGSSKDAATELYKG